MSAAGWLRWAIAALMIAIAGYHLARLAIARRRARRTEADVDLTHAAMGAAMAMMLVGALTAQASRGWALAFAGPTLWFVFRTLIDYVRQHPIGHPLTQAVISGTMVFMLLGTATHGSGMAMADQGPVLLLAAAVVAVAIRTTTSIGRRNDSAAGGVLASRVLAPNLTAACQLAMNGTTVFMLVLMLRA
jgi:Domain of unknown function (DUF5134)